MLFMDIEVLNTDEGRNLRALLEAECSVGTSIRGVGDMEGKYVKNYEILGIDFVGNPSSSTFTRMPVSESVKVEIKDPRQLQETYTVSTSSTNVVRDLEQAALIQQQLESIGYGTVTKTSTKLDQETDPKTGAQTSITTLEAETSDDVSDLDQALQMAKNAMLNDTVNVDSITIENIQEEQPKESVEYVPDEQDDKTTLNEEPINEDIIKNQEIGFFRDGKFIPMFKADSNGYLQPINKKSNQVKKDKPMTEAKKENENDPNLGKKFVLHTDRGFVTFDKNAIDFTDKPEDALHFTEGKEENGMVSMSKVIEILDAMGIFEVKKYFQKTDINLGGTEEKPAKDEGLLGGIAGGIIGNAIGSGYPIAGAALGSIAQDAITDESKEEQPVQEENGNNTKYRATVVINDQNGSKTETISVSAIDIEGAQKEISNLYDMKLQSIEGNGTVDITLIDTITGEQFHFNPQSKLFESALTEDDKSVEVNNNKVSVRLDNDHKIEKQFASPLQAQVATKAVIDGKADPEVLIPEAEEEVTCAWCKDKQAKVDCKKEVDLGWLCPRCVDALQSQGVPLEFTNGMEEKLYTEPSNPSDELQKEPLEDSSNKITVTLTDSDWDMDDAASTMLDDEFVEKIIDQLPNDPWVIDLDVTDLENTNDIKTAILNAINNEDDFPCKIKNATIVDVKEA